MNVTGQHPWTRSEGTKSSSWNGPIDGLRDKSIPRGEIYDARSKIARSQVYEKKDGAPLFYGYFVGGAFRLLRVPFSYKKYSLVAYLQEVVNGVRGNFWNMQSLSSECRERENQS